MRRGGLIGTILLVVVLGLSPAGADDLTPPDGHPGEDCLSEPATGPNSLPRQEDVIGAGPGRMSVCISDGNKTNRNELYVGGDLNKACLHVEVAGQILIRRSGYPGGDPDRFCH